MPRLGAHKYQGEAGSGCVQSIDPHPTPLNSPWVLPKLPTLTRHQPGVAGEEEMAGGGLALGAWVNLAPFQMRFA